MFTGIIESLGKFRQLYRFHDQWRLEVEDCPFEGIKVSESVSVNGICLTVVEIIDTVLIFDVLNETYAKTNLASLKSGSLLNLERSLKAGDRFGGHFVTGHVDGIGQILKLEKKGQEQIFLIEAPMELVPYLVSKGSISVEGVSLTLGKTSKNIFEVYLIPYTLSHTNLGMKNIGDWVNLEVDILAKYARSFNLKETKVTEAFLREHGFFK